VTLPVTPLTDHELARHVARAFEGDTVNQQLPFESNVVSLAEFRECRRALSADAVSRDRFPVKPRPVSMRSIAHQARMLAHLAHSIERTARRGVRSSRSAH
jgi:hypothetical protein